MEKSKHWRSRSNEHWKNRNRHPGSRSVNPTDEGNRHNDVPSTSNGRIDVRNRPKPNKTNTSENKNDNYKNKSRNSPHIGFKYLESLMDEPVEQVMTKISENKGFFDLLEKPLSSDYVVLIMQLISKFCECSFSGLRLRILQKSLNISFINSVHIYISSLPLQSKTDKRSNNYFWKNPDSFWNNFSKICKTVLKEMPQNYCGTLSKVLMLTCLNIPQIETMHDMHISDEIKDEFKSLVQTVHTITAELEKKEQKRVVIDRDEGEPPDDFREISVYPTSGELLGKMKPFLRKNVIEGPYRDAEHYLDVQFRLLREDFVGPLREGINAYLSSTSSRIQNVKIHRKVQFLQPITATEHYCVLLKFNFTKKNTSFSYENSRRFLFGSLVCFTRDNFRSLIFGKIVDRNEKYLKAGELVIGFDVDKNLLYHTDYVMVECSVYFEPYYHVLTVMQQMNEENFPMKEYIIDVDKIAALPTYITPKVVFQIPNFDDREIVTNDDDYPHRWLLDGSGNQSNDDYQTLPHRLEMVNWNPFHRVDQHFHNFNPSQNAAFTAALTRRFSIIQGPPGTGKTFVGLKIAKTLLRNHNSWFAKTPMLIICYTNHALDQFLEGLIDTTEHIVRVGGQSKNKQLEKFNLRNHAHKFGPSTYEHKARVTRCLTQIKKITDVLDMIRKYNTIINFKYFEEVVPQFGNSWLATATDKDMLKWLIETEMVEVPIMQRETQGLNQPEDTTAEDGWEEEEEDRFNVELDYLLNEITNIETYRPLLDLFELFKNVREWNIRLGTLQAGLNENNYDVIFEYTQLEMDTRHWTGILNYCKNHLDAAKDGVRQDPPAGITAINSQYIPKEERWNLYFHWLDLYRDYLMKMHERLSLEFREAYKIFSESKDLENVHVLRNMKVIGMTTTGAARLHSSLQMIQSPIVIVEEAAEVLEAHIITSLTQKCQQLILIGDHKQLRPSTSNYRIERFYNLGISLFERMILNQVQCFTLDIQHRMRPEISSLIKPAIYPNLKDHETVLHRPTIKGLDKCLYFIDHKFPEASETIGTTKKNLHEVMFLIQLAKYLILNGYKPYQVTILAAYLGQMFEIQKQRSKYIQLKDVKVAVLDNYQGEESDIILLSLVRNNTESKIGFLSIENRVCVALSRARDGLYVMGNMTQLCEKSELWVKIKETLQEQGALGSALTLKCQNHNKLTMVSTADDFLSVVEGGCDQICGILLPCGHNCQRLCHVLDREHKENKCQEICNRLLCDTDPLHICLKKCYEDCGLCTYKITRILDCEHEARVPCYLDIERYDCLVELLVTLPCGHETHKPCHIPAEKYNCPFPCDARLECGHSCIKNCHIRDDPDHLQYKCLKECGKPRIGCTNQESEGHMCPKLCCDDCIPCELIVKKSRTLCSHHYNVPCFMDVDEIDCLKPCKKMLPCGHKCSAPCKDPCGQCHVKVVKNIPGCNHRMKLECYVEPDKKYCSGECSRELSCGHICKRRCNQDCDPMKCTDMVDVSIPGKCGHVLKRIPCNMKTLFEEEGADAVHELETFCTEPCNELLNCGETNKHWCTGSCGVCYQGRIHKRCADKCGVPLVCNHPCEVSCRETCKPCRKPCMYKCEHSSCKKRCGEPCRNCKERCNRKCEHQTCRKRCGDICSVPPCEMPCKKRLKKCGHLCAGYCGDPCPQLCPICDKEELFEIFFGTEDLEDARFVKLECGHIVESMGMELWLTQDENEIKFKVCPKCKRTLQTTKRYSDYVKRAIADIMKVKMKQCGSQPEINAKRNHLLKNFSDLATSLDSFARNRENYKQLFLNYLEILKSRLYTTNKIGRYQTINLLDLNSIEIKYQLIQEVRETLKKVPTYHTTHFKSIPLQVEFILQNISRDLEDITTTEIDDIRRETNRLNRMVQLGLILSTSQARLNTSKVEIAEKINEVSCLIHSLSKYDQIKDEKVKQTLTEINKMLKAIAEITEAEKREIVKAVGLSKGHWFKCPNGHPYAIGECGGAMQMSRCIECNERIGGQMHTLLQSNNLAPEMDGAQFAAWSNTANMENYDLEDMF